MGFPFNGIFVRPFDTTEAIPADATRSALNVMTFATISLRPISEVKFRR